MPRISETANDEYDKYVKSFKYRNADHPGEFPAKTLDHTYIEPPVHESGRGCEIILNEDYLDGSVCGMGKSESAWKSIKTDQSVLCVSYRKTFTEKTRFDYNLESYNNIIGDIVFDTIAQRRVITQVESVVRVRGIPDVLIIDEWHGILRQIFSSSRSKTIWEKFVGLITTANRVIVLDADANNDDLVLFRDYLRRQDMKFIYNEYRPDHDKKFIVEPSHKEIFGKLLDCLGAGNPTVVFTHNKRQGNYSVESIAKQLQCSGYRVKYYHADTDSAEKQRDFSDINNAFNNVDVVIYNHTIEAGISIVDDRFRHLFVFSESIGSVEATKQALHRFRCVTQIHYSSVSKSCPGLPLTRDDIIDVIESHERDVLETELLFRAPNFCDVHTSFGHAFISNTIDENNSRRYFTPRLVALMKQSGYEITWTLPDECQLWLEKHNKKNKEFINGDQ